MEWPSIDLSSKLSLTCYGNVNYYKSVHHPIPTLPVRIGNTLAVFKKVSKPSFQLVVQVYSLLGQTEEKFPNFLETLFGGCKKGDRIVRLLPRTLGCHKR